MIYLVYRMNVIFFAKELCMEKDIFDIVIVSISEDEMQCELCLECGVDDDIIQYEDIVSIIEDKGVVYGVDYCLIHTMIDDKIYDKNMVIASGTKVIEGADGYYSYTFNTNPDKKPKLREDGSVDYLNLNLIQCVETGDLLSRYFPRKEGIDGTTVTGKTVKAPIYKNLPPLRGRGFTMSDDGLECYAACDGKVELSVGGITVTKISTIPSDVGIGVGNIDVKGDLEIMGSVLTGLSVKATGNITINGLVEAATITAGRDVLIKGGILGGGRALINAGGNVYAQFVENSAINSGNCVQADSIVNSLVTAHNDINIFGKTSSIMGGNLKANHIIRTKNIGSNAQILTRLNVGVDASVAATLKQKEVQLKEESDELVKIEKAMELISKNPDQAKEMGMLLTRTKIEKTALVTKLKKEIEELRERISIAKYATIIAENMAYQGTIISIDGVTLKLDGDFEKIVFTRKNDKILTKLFVEEDYDKVEMKR